MTIHEAGRRYSIPISILREYEGWGLCDTVKTVTGAWQYDGEDIERPSMIMRLHDIGFEQDESQAICVSCSGEIPPGWSGCGF